jgi:hypothetical protein
MRRFPIALFAFAVAALTVGCATSSYELAVREYVDAASNIRLGLSKAEVTRLLEPSQRRLPPTDRIQPEMYTSGGVLTEVVYFRSRWHSDSRGSFDEFTPYLFENDRLVAVGWTGVRRAVPPSGMDASRAPAPNSVTVLPPF